MSLKDLIDKTGRKVRSIYRTLDEKFYLKDSSIAFMTVSGPLALYIGSQNSFKNDSLNIISNIYGAAAIAGVLTNYTNEFLKSYKKYCEVMK